jgi:hypothetical protein
VHDHSEGMGESEGEFGATPGFGITRGEGEALWAVKSIDLHAFVTDRVSFQ